MNRPGFRPLLSADLADELKCKLLPQRRTQAYPVLAIENVRCTQQTPKAIMCKIDGHEVWIPRTQIHDLSEVKQVGDEGTLGVSHWFARKAQLI